MADFFDRLLAKSAPVPPATDADGVTSVAAQPRLPHPFERPTTAGDLDWVEQPDPESENSRRGNAMELRSEPTTGTRAAAPASPRPGDQALTPPRRGVRQPADSGPRPLLVAPAAEPALPRRSPPAFPTAISQSPDNFPAPSASAGPLGGTPILGTPADRVPATAMPSPPQTSAPAATAPRARLAERGTPPGQRAATAPAPPSVTVRIGRLEVRAATPPAARAASAADRRTREPALKLDEYLSREGGRR
jgi:hypothetical protein